MLVSSVDYPNKRIYLDISTVNTDLDTLAIYKEVRALRRATQSHRSFKPMIVAGGNLPKITGQTYTPVFVQLLYGCRIVPYNSTHKLRLIRDTFTDDGSAGRDCFDRTSLTNAVDIDVDFPEVEVREVTVGGSSLTAIQIRQEIDANSTMLSAIKAKTDIIILDSTPVEIALAMRAELAIELSRIDASISSRVQTGSIVQANVKQMNDTNVLGTGTSTDKWRGV